MTTFTNILKGEPEDGYGIPIDAYIKYQLDHIDRVEPTDEEKYTMDNTMADIQADDMKHYDDLPALIATKLLEVVTMDELESAYYEYQLEWAESLPEEELRQTARDLGISF